MNPTTKKILNQSEMSRVASKGDRNAIRIPNKIPKKYREQYNKVIKVVDEFVKHYGM